MTKYKPVFEMITAVGFALATLMLLFMSAVATEGIEGIWMVVAGLAELGLLVGGAYLLYRVFQRRSGRTTLAIIDQDDMKAKRSLSDDGELVILGHTPGTWLFTFRGTGNQVMDRSVYLTASLYMLKYNCPPEKTNYGVPAPSVKIGMVNVEQDEVMPVMEVSGTGSQTFSVPTDGHYVFQVTCDVDRQHKKWQIECVQL